MFGFNEKPKVPLRHRKSPFMNLAFQKVPTVHGSMDTTPTPLKMLTDEDIHTPITTGMKDTGTDEPYIQIDLGRVYEVYEIVIYSGYNGGYYTNNSSNTGHIYLKTGTTNVLADATQRDDQTSTTVAYVPITLHYEGEGIPVRYVFLSMKGDGTHFQIARPAEIEVFGC